MRWVTRVLSVVVMLALVLVGLVFLIPADRVAQIAARQVESATGRALTVSGGVSASIWPQVGVSTGPVSLANAPWSGAGPMLEAESMAVRLDMAALLRGDIRITAVEVQRPRVVLERAADGRVNWEIAPASAPTAPDTAAAGPARAFGLDRAQISGAQLWFIDHAAGTRHELTDLDLTASVPDLAGPARLDAAWRMNGQPLTLRADVADLATLLAGGVVAVDLTARPAGASVTWAGRLGLAPIQAAGQIDAQLSDPAATFALAGLPAPDLPEGLGRRSAALAGQMTLTPAGSLHLRDGRIALDGNRLTAEADVTTDGPRPRLVAQISAPALDLSGLTGGSGAPAPAGSPASGGWSEAQIDLAPLGLLDADLNLALDAVDLGALRLGRSRGRLALDAARAVIDLSEVAAYDGRIAGQVVVNGRGSGSARVALSLAGVALQPLLRDLAGQDRLIAAMDGQINLLASGNSLHRLMNSLSGDGRFALGRGELRGLDLAGMLRTMDPGHVGEGARTIFDGISGRFTVTEGVLRNDDLDLSAPLLRASGAGTVGIGAQVLDYRLVPVALGREDGSGGLRVPLHITGPWAAPRFRLDARAIADERLEAERERAERRAREAIEERLKVDTEAGETLEDAARRKLEQEVRRGLGRLLGGN